MRDPRKQRYMYMTMSGFGAISLSILFFFLLYRLQGIGEVIQKLSGILAPFIYGGVIAYLLRPVCNAIEGFYRMLFHKKLKRFANAAAVVTSMVIGILVVYALLIMILPQLVNSVVNLWNGLPAKIEQLMAWAEKTFGEDERLVNFFNENYQTYMTDIEKWVGDNVLPQVANIISNIGISAVLPQLSGAAGTVGSSVMPQLSSFVSGVGTSMVQVMKVLYNLLIGLIVAIYVLYGRKRFGRQAVLIVRSLLPDRWARLVLEEAAFVDRMFGGFIDGKVMDSAIVGVLCYVGCAVLRIPNALLVSVLVGVTNIIPFFGPFIGAVPSTFLILIENPLKAVWFVIFVLVLQQLDGNVIGPKILGNRTGLSSFWVLFAIILFGGMWGIVGMIICVPLFAVIYDGIRRAVIRGLRQKGHMELWEEYRSSFPDVEEEKK